MERVWELRCGAEQPADAAAHQRACTAARDASWTQIRRRTVAKRIHQSKAGAAPGPSGWRNGHIKAVQESGEPGRAALMAWCQLWTDGRAGPAADVWRQAMIAALAKANGGIRPISLQEALLKLAANCIAEERQRDLQRAVGEKQFGVGPRARADVAALLLDVAMEEEDTEAMVSLDVANAFGSLWHWAIYMAVEELAPWMLPWLTDVWQLHGLLCWQRTETGWESRHAACGIPQGDPLAAWIYALTQRWLLERCERRPEWCSAERWQKEELERWRQRRKQAMQMRSLAYMDDMSLWGGRGGMRQSYEFYQEALAAGGLKLKPEKCQLLSGTAIAGVPIAPSQSITALGCHMHTDFAVAVGKPAEHPVEKRTASAEALASALVEMAYCGAACAAHCAFVLGQRVLAPALDFDVRVGSPLLVRPRLERVSAAVRRVLCASMGKMEITNAAWQQACVRGELGGFTLRPPDRPAYHAAARWSAMRTTQHLVDAAALTYGMQRPSQAVRARAMDAAAALAGHGIDVSAGLPVLDTTTQKLVAAAAPAQEELARQTLQKTRGLQGTATRLAEVVSTAHLWHSLPQRGRERLEASCGELSGTVHSELPREPREGWLEDDEWRMHCQLQLAQLEVPSGARCQLSPASGPSAGQTCGKLLETQCVHNGRCRAAEQKVRIHNAARHAIASELKVLGMVVDQEAPVPAWTRRDKHGKYIEAVLDVQARVPGSTIVVRLDVECIHTEARTHQGSAPAAILLAGTHSKYERYGQEVAPLVMALRGRWCMQALATLRMMTAMAGMSSRTGPLCPATQTRRLARRVAVAVATAEARARIGSLGGRVSAALIANHPQQAHEPSAAAGPSAAPSGVPPAAQPSVASVLTLFPFVGVPAASDSEVGT